MKFRLTKILKVTLALVFLSIFCAAAFGQPDNKVSMEKMYSFAGKELPRILGYMPEGSEGQYGFKNRDEFKRAGLGIPYQEYSFKTEKPTGYWRVPVTVAGENRALLRLIWVESKWQFAGLGAAVLARDLGKLEREAGKTKPTCGRIIRDFEMSCDYVQFDRTPGAKPDGLVIPLKSAVRALRHLGLSGSIGSDGILISKIKEHRSTLLRIPADKNESGKEK